MVEVPGSSPVTPTTAISWRHPRVVCYFLRLPLRQVVAPLGCSLVTSFLTQLIRLEDFRGETCSFVMLYV